MKSDTFLSLVMNYGKPVLAGLLCCFVLPAHAETPPPETFNQSSELILTLSDEWLEPDASPHNRLLKPSRSASKQFINEVDKPKAANIGCSMDENPIPNMDNSLGSSIVGECNLNYKY